MNVQTRYLISPNGRLLIHPHNPTYAQRVVTGVSNDLGEGLLARAIERHSIKGLPVVIASGLTDLIVLTPLSIMKNLLLQIRKKPTI